MRYKVLQSFAGHGAFKYLIIEKDTVLSSECLRYIGKGNKNIRDLIDAKNIQLTDEEENMTLNWLEEWIEKGKVHKPIIEEKPHIGIRLDNYLINVEEFYKIQPFFYDKSKIFWLWNNEIKCYEITDDVEIMKLIDKSLSFCGQTISSGTKNNYIEAFKRVGRDHIPKPAPEKWIQFKDKAYSLKSGKIYQVEPNYFFTNPIPWELSEISETPVIDKLFEEWVGKDYVQTLYEIIAYCCYRNYPIHLIFCLIGCGRNGKSCFQKLLCKFIGIKNVCSTELDDLLESRFEKAKLYKKLICSLGETNFNIIQKTSLIKKLTGQDLIGYEFKNKDPFDDYNYAKIIINSNSLPSSEDTSEGFYRRWLIINFDNTFPEGKDILSMIPDQEYSNLSIKICKILSNLLVRGQFTNQGDIESRKHKYIINSNPLDLFINHYCKKDIHSFIQYSELYSLYCKFLIGLKRRAVSHKEFTNTLERSGIEIQKTSKKIGDEWVNGRFIVGFSIDDDQKAYGTLVTNVRDFNISSLRRELSGNNGTSVTSVTNIYSNIYNELSDFIKNNPKNNTELLVSTFGQKQISKWLEDGILNYYDENTYLINN